MILCCDLGNTNFRAGIYLSDNNLPDELISIKLSSGKTIENIARSIQQKINDFLVTQQIKESFERIVFSSVNKKYNEIVSFLAESFTKKPPIEVSPDLNLLIDINYENKYLLGSDRIVNAVAAACEYKEKNSLIIDAGTAITFCVLLKGKKFDGGLIAPGVGICLEALATKTSALKLVEFKKPDKMVATNPTQSIESGIFYGWISLVEGIINKIENQYGFSFNIILTGGSAKLLSQHIENKHIYDNMLTMKGLKYIYDLNS